MPQIASIWERPVEMTAGFTMLLPMLGAYLRVWYGASSRTPDAASSVVRSGDQELRSPMPVVPGGGASAASAALAGASSEAWISPGRLVRRCRQKA
jgi:hypothetical protein